MQRAGKTLFLLSACLFSAAILFLSGEPPLLIFFLFLAVAVPWLTANWVLKRAFVRQEKHEELIPALSDFGRLDRSDWTKIALATILGILVAAMALNVFGRGA